MSPPNAVGAAQVRAIIGEASEITTRDTWPKPDMRLMNDDRVPAPSLDDDALPTGWEPWITAEAAAHACPRDYVAAGLIGAGSAWTGNARRAAATADWTEPANLWMAQVGPPSTGKTPALKPMIEASRALERDAEPAWRAAMAQHDRDAEAAKARDKAWRDTVREAATNGSEVPTRPANAEAPVPPARPRVIAMDASTEELQRMLAEAPRGLLHVRDELTGWLGSFDRYGGNGADRAFFLECWNGGAYVCDRVRYHGEPIRIEHAALSILGGMVPDRLHKMLAGADDGLAERLIYIWPTRCRSSRWPTEAMSRPRNVATSCWGPRAGYTPCQWAPTIKACPRRSRCALMTMPARYSMMCAATGWRGRVRDAGLPRAGPAKIQAGCYA